VSWSCSRSPQDDCCHPSSSNDPSRNEETVSTKGMILRHTLASAMSTSHILLLVIGRSDGLSSVCMAYTRSRGPLLFEGICGLSVQGVADNANRAQILHYTTLKDVDIHQVQCLTLMAAFQASVNAMPMSWLLAGQALRVAQDLGLHVSRLLWTYWFWTYLN
jgi:hypothetical protein